MTEWLAAEIVRRLGRDGLVLTAGAAADEVAREIPIDEDLDDETVAAAVDAALAAARRWRLSPGEEDAVWEALAGDGRVTCWMPETVADLGASLRRAGVRRPIGDALEVELALGAASPILADRAAAALRGIGEAPPPAAVIASDRRGPIIEIYQDGSAIRAEDGTAWQDWTLLASLLPVDWDSVTAADPAVRDEVTRRLEEIWPR